MIYVDKIKMIAKKNKYTKWYCNIVTNAQIRASSKKEAKLKGLDYTEEHHILPKSFNMGGQKDKQNYAYLTAREHLICHLLMTKMFDGELKNKAYSAAASMTRIQRRNKQMTFTTRQMAQLKEANRLARVSRPSPMKGKKHKKESIELMRKNANRNIGHTYNRGKKMSQEFCELQRKAMKQRVDEGTHNMLTEDFQIKARKAQQKMFETGTHPFSNIKGSNNVNYDSTVYSFTNKNTGETVNMTRNQLITTYNLQPQNVYHMLKGNRKTVKGWTLLTNQIT